MDSIVIIDNDENNSNITAEILGGGLQSFALPNTGDNGRVTVVLGTANVAALNVNFGGSGGVAALYFCADGAPVPAKVASSGNGAGASVAGSDLNLKAYPNPTLGALDVELSEMTGTREGMFEVKVVDLVGHVLQRRQVEMREGKLKTEFDLGEYTNGFYFIVVEGGERKLTQKVLKQ